VSRRTAWVVAAAVAAVALGAAAVGAVALLVRGGARGPVSWGAGGAYLALQVDGGLPEQQASGFEGLFERQSPSLRGLVSSIDRAADDSRVKGLILQVGSIEAGWGRVRELRDALVRFRASGKPSWAYLDFAGNREYFLASACERIAAAPTAMLDVSGLAAEVVFFRGTLDKIGVEAQFEGVGKYKNAPNQFTETGFTAPHREQMESLVGSLYDQYVSAIAEGRGLGEDEVRAVIDAGPFDGAAARDARLVDELLYVDEVEDRLGNVERVGPGWLADDGASSWGLGRPRMALVYAVGDIVPGESVPGPFGDGTFAAAGTISRGLRQAAADSSIRAIILRVDSPGGSGIASDAIWREVSRARDRKPVIVSMGDAAASGGYYVSMNADLIVAQPSTITGSIGVFSGKLSMKGLYGKLGLSQESVVRGRHAALFSSYEPWTDEERQKIREMNEAFYQTFITKAAEGRHTTPEEIHEVAQGRVWTGAQALETGLVDRLGGLDEAVAAARERVGLPAGSEVRLVVMPEPRGFLDMLLDRRRDEVSARALPPFARDLLRIATVLSQSGPLARLPFDLQVR